MPQYFRFSLSNFIVILFINKKRIMKTTVLKLSILTPLLLGFVIFFTSCQKEEHLANTEHVTKAAGPLILADFIPGKCCHKKFSKRKVNILVNSLTHNFYCSGTNSLTYKFYRNDAPLAPPIVKVSSDISPSFCLPTRSYTIIISNNGVPDLLWNLGGFYIPINPGGSTSPIYELDLTDPCGIIIATPTEVPPVKS